MRINFFGDFVAHSVEGVNIADELKKIISQGDINILNFEAVSINRNKSEYKKILKSGPNIYQCENSPKWIKDNGFTAVSLSNNHIYDYGERALEDTIKAFSSVKTFGAGTWNEAYTPLILTTNNKRIAFFALTHNEFGTLTDSTDKRINKGAAWINHTCIDKLIIETKEKVDYVFIFAHAGVEHLQQPLPEWRERYRALIDLGCDGVIASHPHIIQGWEMYNHKPIIYSLGNFFFPSTNKPTHWYKSIVASLVIDEKGNINVKITPLHFDKKSIRLDTSSETALCIKKANEILHDEKKYISFINSAAIEQQELFYTMFMNGGMARCFTLKKILRTFLYFIRNGKYYNPAWLYNNIQCESHKWFFLRGYKLIHNLI